MSRLLGPELPAFLASFDRTRGRGLRVDPAKVTLAELAALLDLELTPLPWCPHGAVVAPGDGGNLSLGRHPAHLAGLFYLQEPSSMAAATALDARPGWRVIDLAAAPGGKTTQLSALVGPAGLVVANEVVGSRLRPLHDNLERWGATNVVTTSAPVAAISAPDEGFDGALLDAPCSGEALFRRDPAAIRHWSPAAVQGAARRQGELLTAAARLVRPGGVLVYSTCTFNREENEDRLVDLLDAAVDGAAGRWDLEDLAALGGRPAWPSPGAVPTERAARFWPHLVAGEGQFVARLRRTDRPADLPPGTVAGRGSAHRAGSGGRRGEPGRSGRDHRPRSGATGRTGARPEQAPGPALAAAWQDFSRATTPGLDWSHDRLVERREWLFLVPPALDRSGVTALAGLQRPGLPLGRLRPGRFEPHPALAPSLRPDQAGETVGWDDDDPAFAAYLRGETVAHPGPDAWVLVCYRRWPLGWARRRGGILKNAFPPQLRRQAAGLPSGG